MGQRFSQVNPEWQRLVNELMKAQDQAKYTHAVHCDRIHLPAGPKLERTVGCFSYALAEPGCVRLHFNSRDQTQESSLSSANRPARQAELSELLSHLRVSAGDNAWIIGASWLYNLNCYRSLFSPPYLSSLRVVEHPYQRMPLWGQFLKRDRSVRTEAGANFLAKVAQAANLTELAACFPLPVLVPEPQPGCSMPNTDRRDHLDRARKTAPRRP